MRETCIFERSVNTISNKMSAENRRNVLFLPKWYPDRKQDQNGNFIQQHAQAIAQYANVVVVYANHSDFKGGGLVQFEFKKDGGIPTFLFYYKQHITGIGFIDKLIKMVLYFSCLSRGFRIASRIYGRPDLIHVHVLLRTGIFARYKCLTTGLPYIITEHWTLYLQQNAYKIGLLRKWLTWWVVKNAAAVNTVSEDLKKAMQNLGFQNKNYTVIPNVVDTATFYPEKHTDFAGKIRFLHVAVFNEKAKNLSGLLRTFQQLIKSEPNAELHIIGFGEAEEKLKDLAKELGLLNSSVFFEGKKETPEVAEYMRNSEVFVLFSNFENLPCVLIEALASGLPVISSNVGGISEMIGREQGILVPPRDEKALLQALQFMAKNHQEFPKEKLREYAENKFSYAAVNNQFAALYESVLDSLPVPA